MLVYRLRWNIRATHRNPLLDCHWISVSCSGRANRATIVFSSGSRPVSPTARVRRRSAGSAVPANLDFRTGTAPGWASLRFCNSRPRNRPIRTNRNPRRSPPAHLWYFSSRWFLCEQQFQNSLNTPDYYYYYYKLSSCFFFFVSYYFTRIPSHEDHF